MAAEMTMQMRDPLNARLWFTLRTPVNWVITLAVFIPLVFILQYVFSPWIGDVIAIAIAFTLFFFFLDSRAIKIECPNCHSTIETDTPWSCGHCGTENYRTEIFPFIGRCGNNKCRAKPKAYLCHHCDKIFFLTKDKDKAGFARSAAPAPEKKKDEHLSALVEKAKNIQLKKLSVEEAELDVKLKGYGEILNPPKPKTHREILEESASEFKDRNMSGAEIIRRMKKENAEKYKDDPAELEKQNAWVDQWARNNLDNL